MISRTYFQHNLREMLVLAWKCASIPCILSSGIQNVASSENITNRTGIFKNRFSSFNNSNASEESTVSDLHKEWFHQFKKNDIPEPQSSIKYIIEHVLGINKAYQYELHQNEKVTEHQEKLIKTLCECRLARMPVQYIIKEWDFRELKLTMRPPVFIPRPETEQLVDLILETASPDCTFLEVGCGSGAICLSLLKALPKAKVIAVDQSKMACQLTSCNAQQNNLNTNLQVIHSKLKNDGSFSEPLPLGVGEVDVIVSNPPYVPSPQLMDLQPEIKLYEDLRALEAGRDGLRVIKSLLLLAQAVLRPGGLVFLEVDSSHPRLIEKWLADHPQLNIEFVRSFKDYCDRDRFVELKKF